MALVVAGIEVSVRELILRDKPEPMLEASPKGTVPVLVLPDGEVVDESLAVMDWAIDQGTSDLQKPSAQGADLIAINDGQFKHDLDRYKYPSRYENVDPLEHRASGATFLKTLNEALSDTGQLAGAEAGYADYATFPFVRQFRVADQDWFDGQDWPHLHTWLNNHMESHLFKWIMRKFPLWNDTGEEPILGPVVTA